MLANDWFPSQLFFESPLGKFTNYLICSSFWGYRSQLQTEGCCNYIGEPEKAVTT